MSREYIDITTTPRSKELQGGGKHTLSWVPGKHKKATVASFKGKIDPN